MRVVTATEMREMDSWAIERLGVPGVVLMENAGRGVVRIIGNGFGGPSGLRVAIVCGGGNNGGDGSVIARWLANVGASVRIFLLSKSGQVRGDARTNLDIAIGMGIRMDEVFEERRLGLMRRGFKGCDLIVDAIFGTGFRGEAKGIPGRAIDLINDSGVPAVSVDVPSGLNSDNGSVEGPCVRAVLTATMGLPKRGLLLYPGRGFVGDLYLVDIGTPHLHIKGPSLELVERNTVRQLIPPRPPNGHKGSFGHLLVVGGSRGMSGAAALTSYSALKSGAGLVYLAIPESLNTPMEAALTEVITIPLPETPEGCLSIHALPQIEDLLAKVDVLALGPGLSTNDNTGRLVRALLPRLKLPTVIDADGLNLVVKEPKILRKVKAPLMITPHPGELSRLIGKTISEIERDRVGYSQSVARDLKSVLVLKGAPTVIANTDGSAHINPTGNSGLATAGSGDVLTGIIGAMLAQGLSPVGSGIVGAYLHGLAGDIAAEEVTPYGVVAGDVVDMVPEAIREVFSEEREDREQPILRRPL